MKHLSLQICRKLNDQSGDNLPESEKWWVDPPSHKYYLGTIDDVNQCKIMRYVQNHYRAYDWFEVTVTHARFFFGEIFDTSGSYIKCSKTVAITSQILYLLQQGKRAEAESYFEENALLFNSK